MNASQTMRQPGDLTGPRPAAVRQVALQDLEEDQDQDHDHAADGDRLFGEADVPKDRPQRLARRQQFGMGLATEPGSRAGQFRCESALRQVDVVRLVRAGTPSCAIVGWSSFQGSVTSPC